MRVLSLFDGIACGRAALDRIGITPSIYLTSEIEPNAAAVAKRNWPDIVPLGDVRQVAAYAQQGLLGEIDLLLAGSPCQGFSTAGKQLNFSDPRSRLFFDFVTIKNAVKPRNWLLENVKMRKDWLALISMYVGARPVFIDSADFSAQSRQRYYWTNLTIVPWVANGPLLTDILLPGWVADRPKSYCIDANYGKGTNFRRYFHCGSRQIVFRAGRVPLVKPRKDIANLHQRLMMGDWRKLDPVECERLQTLPDGYTDGLTDFWRYHAIGNAWTVDVISHILKGLLDG